MKDSAAELIRARVNQKIDSFVEGDLEHATETISAFWEIANKDGDIKAPTASVSSLGLFSFYVLCVFHSTRPRQRKGKNLKILRPKFPNNGRL